MKLFIRILSTLLLLCCTNYSDCNTENPRINNTIYYPTSELLISDDNYDDTIIVVTTAKELLKAIGSNRTIQLNAAKFTLNDTLGISCYFDSLFNLKLVGIRQNPIKLHQENPWGHVISFENCGNIILENLDIGHYPDIGWCEANVLNLSNCKNVEIKNCLLFGTGQIGINASNIENLTCTKITVYDCSLHLLNLSNAEKILFSQCKFINAETNYSALDFKRCSNVTFRQCQFKNIRVTEEEMHYDHIIETYESKAILFDDCKFKNNKAYNLTHIPSDSSTIFSNCIFNNNHFNK